MADLASEIMFVGIFWSQVKRGEPEAEKILAHIEPTMFDHEGLGGTYREIRKRHAAGESLDDVGLMATLREVLGSEIHHQVDGLSRVGFQPLKPYAAKILAGWRAKETVKILDEAKSSIEGNAKANPQKVAESALSRLFILHRNGPSASHSPQTREELVAHELAKLDRKQSERPRVVTPYAKLRTEMGDLLPGDLVGISAYSNGGKSLLLANLFRWFAVQGSPCIVFPTEMRERWLSRAYAAHARIKQRYAEREEWENASEEEKEKYRFAVNDLASCPWEVVNRPRVSVREIISRASILRRKYVGKPVVVMVDHMHRLDYGGGKPEVEVGAATRELRDWAASDEEGGIVLMLLYQPRKPEDETELYKPVRGYQIKGVSEVWNEMDIHISPHRRWVKMVPGWETNPMHQTPWGSGICLYDSKGNPMFSKPMEAGAKLDDQHAYIKLDKRRVGGEGPTVMLNVDGPTGYIYDIQEDNPGKRRTLHAVG
jgi:replicative DNA helicase